MEKEKLTPSEIAAFIAVFIVIASAYYWIPVVVNTLSGTGKPIREHKWSEPDSYGIQHCTLKCGTSRFNRVHPGYFFPKKVPYYENKGVKSAVGFPCMVDEAHRIKLPPIREPREY
ncbi:hypothetical protein ACQKLP_21925 [Chitinophaga sp. NPDC101104]|uniref:hypothetical protein n=1 Tax=Chitinophaga sp. NPDC101104 TaxID=3390561 RepID=UPI003CFC15C2